MNIAVDTRLLLKDKLEGAGYFTREVFRILARQHPQHRFYFLFDHPYDREFIFSENIHPLILPPSARHPVLRKYWFDVKLPVMLRKIGADVFVAANGFCSLNTKIPQCLIVHDPGFLHHPGGHGKSRYRFYRHYIPRFLKKASRIAVDSAFFKNEMVNSYPVAAGKIDVVYQGVREVFRPAAVGEQTAIKEKYTAGREFFLYAGTLQSSPHLINLLKAFSIFKKRQQSGMKLVLTGRADPRDKELLPLLQTYKYREDVVLTNDLKEEELAALTASAYALVCPSLPEGSAVAVLEAMKCGVPALGSNHPALQEIGEAAALYFSPADPADAADKLMLIYKDENLRSRLVESGKQVAGKYSWQRTADGVWESVLKAVRKE